MTLPIIPGPFSFLKGATDAGLDAYYRAQQRKDMLDQIRRQQDMQTAAMYIQNILPHLQPQTPAPMAVPGVSIPGMGMTPPVQVQGAPAYEIPGGVAESLERLGFGRPRLGKSAATRKQESDVRVAEGTEQPTISTAQSGAIQAGAQARSSVAQAALNELISRIKVEAASDPAVARAIADVLPSEIARGREAAAAASVAPEAYMFAAENFVAQTKGDPKAALKAAAADPQYAELVSSGQLSQEYFDRAAKAYARLEVKDQQAWAEIAARRQAQQSQERLYYDSVIRSYDREITQLQSMRRQFDLEGTENLFAQNAKKKAEAGMPLSPIEQGALDKVTKQLEIEMQIKAMEAEREDMRSRFIGRAIPGGTTSGAAPQGSGVIRGSSSQAVGSAPQGGLSANAQKVLDAVKAGTLTKADVQKSKALSEAEKAAILGRIP